MNGSMNLINKDVDKLYARYFGTEWRWNHLHNIINYLLTHDLEEAIIGDIPVVHHANCDTVREIRDFASKKTSQLLPSRLKDPLRELNASEREYVMIRAHFLDRLDWILQQLRAREARSLDKHGEGNPYTVKFINTYKKLFINSSEEYTYICRLERELKKINYI